MSETLKVLDDALYEVSGGTIVRGSALTATPERECRSDELREAWRRKVRRGAAVELMRWHDFSTQAEFCSVPILTRYTQTSENPVEREDNAGANKRF
jgi:hypothetical protein